VVEHSPCHLKADHYSACSADTESVNGKTDIVCACGSSTVVENSLCNLKTEGLNVTPRTYMTT
jgi:hypothetical protein